MIEHRSQKKELVQKAQQWDVGRWLGAGFAFFGLWLIWLNVSWLRPTNWWAIFILIPALAFLLGARSAARDDKVVLQVLSRIGFGVGAITLTVAIMFLLNLDWNRWWPLMVMVPGMVLFANGHVTFSLAESPHLFAVANMVRWLGRAVALFGLTCLADALGFINLSALFGDWQWWGFFILLPGVGAWVNGMRWANSEGEAGRITAVWLALFGLIFVILGVMELVNLSWQFLLGSSLIVVGMVLVAKRDGTVT